MITNGKSWTGRAAGLGVALMMFGLSACGGSTAGQGGQATVTFSYLWSGAESNAIQKIIAEYNASQTSTKVVGVSNPDMQKQLASMSSSQGSFDLSDNFGSGVGSWAAKGVLEPLDGYMSASGVKAGDFVPAAMDQMRYQGQTYSLPVALHDFELVYNKKLLTDAGITAPPSTTEELAADIAKLTKVDASGNITQLGLGNPDTGTTLTTLGYSFGGKWDGADGKPSPQDSGNLAGLGFYRTAITDKYGAEKVAKFTAGWGQYGTAQDPFYTGKVAMIIDGEWQPRQIAASGATLDWGAARLPAPSTSPDLAGTTQITASTLFIPRNARNKKAAFEFMKYLTSGPGAREFTMALGNLPARTSLLADPAYAAIPQFSTWLQGLKSNNLHALASRPYSAQYSADLVTAFNNVLHGSQTPQQAMAEVAGKAKNYASQ